jgi:phosphatidylinositol alpha-1,6-mannosyltransferase
VRRRIARSGDLLLLSIGRLQRRKGHDLVIQALAACRQALPQLRYVIIGDGDERPRLEQMVRELGLGGTVTFEGEVPADSLPAYYAACDIFVMPNRVDGVDVEGFGIVFLEAAATGRPTIGGRSGGVPEAIDENRTGLLVSGTDAPELVAALTHLAGSAELRTSMGAAGRARVVERFNWERAAADVTALHRSLLKDDR